MAIFLLFIMILLIGMVAYNNYAAFRLLRKNVYSNTFDTLELYQKHLDKQLSQAETYLRANALDNNAYLNTLHTTTLDDTRWFSACYHLRQSFNTSVSSYITDAFFYYLPESNQLIHSYSDGSALSSHLKNTITSLLQSDQAKTGCWVQLNVDEEYYFLYTLYVQGAYVGSWVSMEHLLDSVNGNDGRLFFSAEDGTLLQEHDTADVSSAALSVSHELDTLPLQLTILVPESELTDHYHSLIYVIATVILCILLIGTTTIFFLNHYILKPVFSLTAALEQVSEGHMDTSVSIHHQPEEFQTMSRTFNEMTQEIQNLKIDVYERKLQKQRLEMQYLKQQITPHFMINCLNAAYQLTESAHPDLALKMLRDLSSHLRYTLSSGQTVPLCEELRLLRNYIELSGIRDPNSISYFEDCPETLYQAAVPPLILLNFVENTIKYEIEIGSILGIHVEISGFTREDSSWMLIRIWDTGKGFSEDILPKLQNIEAYAEHEDYHIGIVNVYLRACHIYGNPHFTFSNLPDAGAQITIEVPFLQFSESSGPVQQEAYHESYYCR
jgi:two-component system sensor histidine kinase YesM